MKLAIRNSELEIVFAKILISANPLKELKLIKEETIFLSPLTKISELFTLSSANFFFKFVNQNYAEAISQIAEETKLAQLVKKIHEDLGYQILDYNTPLQKYLKFFLEIDQNLTFNDLNLEKILAFLDQAYSQTVLIVLIGFDHLFLKLAKQNFRHLRLLAISSSFSNFEAQISDLELFSFIYEKELIDIIDSATFLNWLEYKTKMVLSYQDINDFLAKKATFNAFLLSKALKSD